jgi:hypothetical protein
MLESKATKFDIFNIIIDDYKMDAISLGNVKPRDVHILQSIRLSFVR